MYQYLKDSCFSKKLFWIGIFFLPSAPSISFIILLLSSVLSFKENFTKLKSDNWNLFFLFIAILFPIICLFQSDSAYQLANNWNKSLTWIGLTNWIPLIFCFLSFQFFLKTLDDRKIMIKFLISGSIPVIFSGFAQYFFQIYGPFETLNGFIIWFQRPIKEISGLTSLFHNQNYAGAWFCIVWPFSLAILLDSFNKKIKKYIALSILISITISIILTTSRSAWGGLILLIPLMTGISSLTFLFPIIFLVLILFLLAISNYIPSDLQNFLRELIPTRFLQEFTQEYSGISRLDIWSTAITFISKRPIFGWGAAAFPVLFFFDKEVYIGHAHNLVLELAISYGIPITLLIFGSIFTICMLSFRKIFTNKNFNNTNFIDRAWFSSFVVLLFAHFVDIQYFDGRISIIFWVLLAGLKEIIGTKNSQKELIK